jgi:hypothetical protein
VQRFRSPGSLHGPLEKGGLNRDHFGYFKIALGGLLWFNRIVYAVLP